MRINCLAVLRLFPGTKTLVSCHEYCGVSINLKLLELNKLLISKYQKINKPCYCFNNTK